MPPTPQGGSPALTLRLRRRSSASFSVIGDGPRSTEGTDIMATIANLTQKQDGSLEGTLATLNVTAQIALIQNTRKTKENEPDYRIISRKNGFALGAGWHRFSQDRKRVVEGKRVAGRVDRGGARKNK